MSEQVKNFLQAMYKAINEIPIRECRVTRKITVNDIIQF